MTNKLWSVLDHIGHDIKVSVEDILPIAQAAGQTLIPSLFPFIGPAFNATVGVAGLLEQKYSTLGTLPGTGPAKLAEATNILGPALAIMLGVAGKSADNPTVQAYINSVVAFLKAIPAPQTAPAAA